MSKTDRLRFTPFHLMGFVFIASGLVLAVYHGLTQFGIVPRLGWMSWSHIHFVTIGGFTQLLFGMLPQLAARKLGRPVPGRWFSRLSFIGLNGGFLLLWYGRGWGHAWAFDFGLYAVWLTVAGLLVVLLRMSLKSDEAWDATVGLYLIAVFVFLWGISYAYGLFIHMWEVPGGWLGLREAHVHANAWGFLGLAAIGTLYDLFPRLLDTELYSERLRDYSVWLFGLGIFPLITGPWMGLGRTVTAVGLILYASGFALYLYNLIRTYRGGTKNGLATSILAAQFWLLGPAGFAPFVLFGIEWVRPAYIEDGALHFFFLGWALPIALAGILLYFRNLPGLRPGRLGIADRVDPTDILPDGTVPAVMSRWTIGVWNVAILVIGVGFFYQDLAWSAYFFGVGYTVAVVIWGYELAQAARLRWRLRNAAASTAADVP